MIAAYGGHWSDDEARRAAFDRPGGADLLRPRVPVAPPILSDAISRSYIVGMAITLPLTHLSDDELLAQTERRAAVERMAQADLVESLAELDARRLYLAVGCSSLFTYCTERLHLSDHAAYRRIEAARALRRFPAILARLREGALTLTAIGLLSPHLTEENHRALLDASRHQSKRAVEALVARLRPRPDVPSSLRKLPVRHVATTAAAAERAVTPDRTRAEEFAPPRDGRPRENEPSGVPLLVAAPDDGPDASPPPRPAVLRPLSPTRYLLQVTVSQETHAKLRRAQDLLRHVAPAGDPALILDRALTVLVEHLERQTFARLKRARKQVTSGQPESAAPAMTMSAQNVRPEPQRHVAVAMPPAPSPVTASPDLHKAGRRSRSVPAAVRRAVWLRDGGQCAFVGASGRCSERGCLEFHHVTPFADGGAATINNVELRCRQHNTYEARRWFGVLAEDLLDSAPTRSGPS